MAELIKLEVKQLPELLVVGKEISITVNMKKFREEKVLPKFWDKCFSDGTLKELEKLTEYIYDPSYVGFMSDGKGSSFSYLVGMLMRPGCPISEGFTAKKIPESRAAVGWIMGIEQYIYEVEYYLTNQAITENGFRLDNEAGWSMELYNCPRFTTPDDDGQIILDFYLPVK